MEIVRGFHNLRPRHRGCVLTIGNFDGVHRGHQALIARTRELAAQHGLPPTLLTFEPTPREFFSKDGPPGRVATFRGKLALLAQAGIERVVIQRFSRDYSALAAAVFVEDFLVGRLGVKAIVTGDDFRFGCQRQGDLQLLQVLGAKHGFSAESLPTVIVDGERCSSTALRAALAQPDLARAAALLGRPYSLLGRVRRGLQLGRTLAMPTANIAMHRLPALKLGVYAVRAYAHGRWCGGVASLGVRPTLGITRCLLETHLFETPADLYGAVMEVEFRHFLRPELRFESLDALAVQMQRDKQAAQALLRL
ncbi:MAG TPA: bifunctional riboflavin kinase/FAD synthetase [Solimonas sp.]|nr:bifunctional riboflavin kinase/FAD synthetase [Solimonas sp.]